jgi:hypothetical protein
MRKIASVLTLMASALPMAPASATDTLAAELQPFAFLAGSCWRGPAPGGAQTDTHCFTPMLGHFLRDRHVVLPSHYSGETLYRWDAAARQIRLDYYSSDGMLMSGTAAATERGLSFELSYLSAEGAPTALRGAWTRDGDDAYLVTMEVQGPNGWRAMPGSQRFQRIGPAPAD